MTAHAPARLFPEGESPTGETTRRGRRLPTRTSPTLIDLSRRIRPRDYTIAVLLDEHTTLTTDQITAILFTHPTTCRHRLDTLRTIGFVDRFLRNRPGAANPTCWVPGLLSARWAALHRGDTPPTPKALREQQDRVYASPQLAHQQATNAFFVALLAHARRHPHTALTRWWSERATNAAFGRRIRPDGHGVWTTGERNVGFHLELDRGTEPLGRLVERLASHRRLCAEGGPAYPVLFALPSRAREQNLHRRLADHPEPTLTIATTSPESGDDPAGPVWRLAGNGRHRQALTDLPSSHGQPGPLNPGPPQPDQDPLHQLHVLP